MQDEEDLQELPVGQLDCPLLILRYRYPDPSVLVVVKLPSLAFVESQGVASH